MKKDVYGYVKDFIFIMGFIFFAVGLFLVFGLGITAIVSGLILMLLCFPFKIDLSQEPVQYSNIGAPSPKPLPPPPRR